MLKSKGLILHLKYHLNSADDKRFVLKKKKRPSITILWNRKIILRFFFPFIHYLFIEYLLCTSNYSRQWAYSTEQDLALNKIVTL